MEPKKKKEFLLKPEEKEQSWRHKPSKTSDTTTVIKTVNQNSRVKLQQFLPGHQGTHDLVLHLWKTMPFLLTHFGCFSLSAAFSWSNWFASINQFRNKPTHLWSINLWERKHENTMEKKSLFSKWCWASVTATCKSMKLEHALIPWTKVLEMD